jgi:hypothetical protein
MTQERLEFLLRHTVTSGPLAPRSLECLGAHAILRLLDRPDQAQPEELQHLARCSFCQHAVALARRHRRVLDAPWTDDEVPSTDSGRAGVVGPATTDQIAAPPPIIKLRPWLIRVPAVAGIAAVVVIALWLGWWRTRERDLLGPILGRFEVASVTRGEERPRRRYVVTIELKSGAYLTFLYLDHTGKLQLARDATDHAELRSAGTQPPFWVDVTNDPSGWQWIAAVASAKPFSPKVLCAELQRVLAAPREASSFDERIDRVERALQERGELSFRGQRFEVQAAEVP